MDFPAGAYTRDAVVTDFLPPNTTYVAGSQTPVAPTNTATIASFADAGSTPDELTWTLGSPIAGNSGLYVSPEQTFLVDFALVIHDQPPAGNNFDVVDNLMTLAASNTNGESVSRRDSATYELTRPTLGLTKGITSINGTPRRRRPTRTPPPWAPATSSGSSWPSPTPAGRPRSTSRCGTSCRPT